MLLVVSGGRLRKRHAEELQAQVEVTNHRADPPDPHRAPPAFVGQVAMLPLSTVSSRFGLVGMPFTLLTRRQAGIAHFGEALRRELYGEGVHVINDLSWSDRDGHDGEQQAGLIRGRSTGSRTSLSP